MSTSGECGEVEQVDFYRRISCIYVCMYQCRYIDLIHVMLTCELRQEVQDLMVVNYCTVNE